MKTLLHQLIITLRLVVSALLGALLARALGDFWNHASLQVLVFTGALLANSFTFCQSNS